MTKPEKIYFANLDAMRSIACLFVLVSHIFWEFLTRHFPGSFFVDNPVSFFFLGNGGFGVRIFFTLSGFLITFLIIKEIQKTGKLSVKNFYIRRVLRIWPVYFVVVFFVFVIYGLGKKFIGNESIIHESPWMSMLFLSNYDLIRILDTPSAYPNGMLSLSWSVSVEEQFYLFWPLLFFLVPLRYFKWIILVVLTVSVIFSFANAGNIDVIYHHTLSNFIFLGAGGFLAYTVVYKPSVISKFARITKKGWLGFFLAGLAFVIFLREPLFELKGGIVVYFIGTAVVLSFLLLNQVADMKRPFEFGNSKFLVRMGKYTYGLYMYHRIAMFLLTIIFSKVFGKYQNIYSDIVFMMLCFLFAFLLSFMSYRFMEKPLLKLKDKFSFFRKA